MTRPRRPCTIQFCPKVKVFMPNGKECDGCVELSAEEAEALRLKHVERMDQVKAAKEMKISQSTFQRILVSAARKISEGIVYGRMIKILDENPAPKIKKKVAGKTKEKAVDKRLPKQRSAKKKQ
jgi:predicted DNA-binding protein (UPF0251 family)